MILLSCCSGRKARKNDGAGFALALARSQAQGQAVRRQSGKGRGMTLGQSGRRREPLYVLPMALALVLAAFLGGALGLVWQASGLGQEEPAQAQAEATP